VSSGGLPLASYNFFYNQLSQKTKQLFPQLPELAEIKWEYLISPLELRLPKAIWTKAAAAISAVHAISRTKAFEAQLEPVDGISDIPKVNESVLMAFDFHTNEAGECRLVEINTNASGFWISSLMELTHLNSAVPDYLPLDLLAQAFTKELELAWKEKPPGVPTVAIVDEDLANQKMRPEFLMYREWFRSLGWRAELCDSREITFDGTRCVAANLGKLDLIYNRLTDFYLEKPIHAPLRRCFISGGACFSPNPREYWLQADKQRLIQLADKDFVVKAGATPEQISALEQVLIPSFEKTAFPSSDAIWDKRKQLFFKPKRSFGGKSVYRGSSVSRKVFERLMAEDILIQHYWPAQRVPVDDPRSVLNNWRFDLRFFVYAERIQLVVARIYQGQVTNFSSQLGGFTRVLFET
jgi:hypothetical protein